MNAKLLYLWGIHGKTMTLNVNLAGALLNVGINALLIPHCGAFGAAFTSFITQMFTNFLLGFLIKELRPNNQMLLTGIKPRFMLNVITRMMNLLIRRNL